MYDRLEIYEIVKSKGIPNFRGAKVVVPSGLNVTAWEEVQDVLSNPEVVNFVKYGFPIGYDNKCIPPPATCNHSSAVNYAKHVDKYLITELQTGQCWGRSANPLLSGQW